MPEHRDTEYYHTFLLILPFQDHIDDHFIRYVDSGNTQ